MTVEPHFAVLGEALVDLAGGADDEAWLARPGGSPYNVAIGLARLGRPTAFVGRISRDPLGTILRNHAARSGVDLTHTVRAMEPTTIALVELADGIADYRFGVEGTADFAWTDAELAAFREPVAVAHFGSLASWTPPGDAAIVRRIEQLRATTLISYDPNVRPHLQTDRTTAREQVERCVRLAHVVKASADDLAWLYPDTERDEAAAGWLRLGAILVVVTAGSDGATAYANGRTSFCPARPVEVADTVGAGDAFTAGLLDALATCALITPDAVRAAEDTDLIDVLAHASLVAALTCARAGANPPRRSEVEAARG